MSEQETKRAQAARVADAVNQIEGVPVSAFARDLSAQWISGTISGTEMRNALLKKHTKTA